MKKPNLFSFATSELSQDAMICWLLSWASPEYKDTDSELHCLGVSLIEAFFEKHGKKVPVINDIKVKKQDNRIDVLCELNDEFAILIEDKTGTTNHSNQLVRYLEEVKSRKYKEENILPIYYKTEDQGDYSDIEEKGYQVFRRDDILEVLKPYQGNDSIATDYREYLQGISDQVQAYREKPLKDWGWYSWVGFYIQLQEDLGGGNWGYVPNPSGGFAGFWWHFHKDEGCEQYLQLEQKKLCYKIAVDDSDKRREYREKWYQRIINQSSAGFPLRKPARFGTGQWMTVCIYDGDYRVFDDRGVLNMKETIKRLKQAEEILIQSSKTV